MLPPRMAIKQLDAEQVRTWTLEQKDRWWFANVWRGDMPQLTMRSAITGMVLGGILSLTNLYVGAKTGWTLGVGITSVILAFAAFKLLSQVGLGREFTLLENNAMQSIATAAGYMTSPLISSLAAYMMVTNSIVPQTTTMMWIIAIALLGVLFAFPLKRRFINDEQHPFPEGRAAGIVMDALHTGEAIVGMFKARLLVITGGAAALLKLMQSHAIMTKLKASFLTVPEFLDGWVYKITALRIMGTDLRELTVRPDTDFVMMAAGGLMATASLAPIAKDFQVDSIPVSLMGLTLPALTFALTIDRVLNGVTRPVFGWISDRIGRENTMFLAFMVEGAGILALGMFAHSPMAFVLLTGLVFFAWGEIYSLFPSTCADTYGDKNATANAGLLYTAKGTASLMLPAFLAIQTATGSWQNVFYLASGMAFIAGFLALFVLKPMRARFVARNQ